MAQVQASSSRDQNDWENYKVLQSKATKTKKIQEQNEQIKSNIKISIQNES